MHDVVENYGAAARYSILQLNMERLQFIWLWNDLTENSYLISDFFRIYSRSYRIQYHKYIVGSSCYVSGSDRKFE